MGTLAKKMPHLLGPPESQTRGGRSSDNLMDRLLKRFDFVSHQRKLRHRARTVNSPLRENLVEQEVHDHTCHGDVHPQRPGPAGDFFVQVKTLQPRAVQGN